MFFRSFGGWGVIPIPPDERREMQILDVKTPGKLLEYRGRVIRTPASFSITEAEIKKFKVMLNQAGITEYTLRSKDEVDKEKLLRHNTEKVEDIFIDPKNKNGNNEVIIEEIMDSEEETKSVLDQLIKDAEKE